MELSLEQPYIRETQCNCKAGLGQCNHLIGLLYTLAHFVKMGYTSVPPATSKTSLPQAWHIPSRALGVSPRTVSSVSVSKLKPLAANAPPPKRQRASEGVMSNLYCPVSLPLPSNAFAESLHQNLSAIQSKSQMFKLLEQNRKQPAAPVSTNFGDLPKGSVLTYHTAQYTRAGDYPPFPLPSQPCSFSTVLDDTEACFYSGLTVTQAVAIQLEIDTREQSHSKTWHKVRTNRLTSSSFKRICSRVADFNVLADNLKKKTVQTKAMKRGLELEPVAAADYQDLTGFEIFPCGFVVNHHAPHLGASPDRKVIDPSASPTHGVLEIKCPNKDSVRDCKYLHCNTDGSLSLKTTHEYYFQVMGQMGITGLKWCDFFVKCKDDHHLERVHFEPKRWENMKCKLDTFFFTFFLPAVCNKNM